MSYDTLLFWTPGPIEMIIVLLVFVIPIVAIVMFVRYVLGNRRENIRLRLEVGKLADELEQSRKLTEDKTNDQP